MGVHEASTLDEGMGNIGHSEFQRPFVRVLKLVSGENLNRKADSNTQLQVSIYSNLPDVLTVDRPAA